jgi:hypothetical protein
MSRLVPCLALLAGCLDVEQSTTSDPVSSGLVLEVVTPTDVSGEYLGYEGTVHLVAHTGPTVTAQLQLADTTIAVAYDPRIGAGGQMTLSVLGPLGQTDRDVLHELALALDRAFPWQGDPRQRSGALLRTYAGFMTDWTLGPTRDPIATAVPPYPQQEPGQQTGGGGGSGGTSPPPCQVSDDDGVTLLPQCCNGGTLVNWQHDAYDHCFVTMTNMCGMGSASSGDPLATDCPGRCGSGCSAIPLYTQDCLDHDLCLMHHKGLGPTDPTGSCGDELREAVDDVAYVYASGAGFLAFFGGNCF